ncbi:MAG: hypothetical protein QW344_09030 [Saccharolobus sp.]
MLLTIDLISVSLLTLYLSITWWLKTRVDVEILAKPAIDLFLILNTYFREEISMSSSSLADQYYQEALNLMSSGDVNQAINVIMQAIYYASQCTDISQYCQTIYNYSTQALQQLGYNQTTGTSTVVDELNQITSLLQQEQNKNSYTESDLQAIENAIKQLSSIYNSLNNYNPLTAFFADYINNNIISNAYQIEASISKYLEQQKTQQQQKQTQQIQAEIRNIEDYLQSGNVSVALSALQNAEQIANQIGDSQDASTISQAIQILNSVQQQLNSVSSTIQQEQNKSSYSTSDLQAIQNAISTLNSINNSVGNNAITSYLSAYISNLANAAQQIGTNIQSYLEQQQTQQTQQEQEQQTQLQNLIGQVQNDLQNGNVSSALSALQNAEQIANRKEVPRILSEVQRRINKVNWGVNTLKTFPHLLIIISVFITLCKSISSSLVKRLTLLFNDQWKLFRDRVVRGSSPRGGTSRIFSFFHYGLLIRTFLGSSIS